MPVLHYDRPPQGDEKLLFTSTPANEWNEDWVALDLNDAQNAMRALTDGFNWLRRGLPGN